jgi:hypothetical protein
MHAILLFNCDAGFSANDLMLFYFCRQTGKKWREDIKNLKAESII